MATQTTNLHLKKPAYSDTVDVADLNGNMDIIDAAYNTQSEAIAKLDSNANTTNDILADATNCTTTTFFNGSGSAYTGNVPSESFKYGCFIVLLKRGSVVTRIQVIAIGQYGDMATNAYTSGAWEGWSCKEAIKCNTSIPLPAEGQSKVASIPGLTAAHELIRWNFSNSAENNPPVCLSWTTAAGQVTITNINGTSNETIKPVFAIVVNRTATIT